MAATIGRKVVSVLSKSFRLSPHFRPQSRTLKMSSAVFGDLNQDFKKAQERLKTLRQDPGNDAKLKIYGLFKQAHDGKCNKPKPGMTDFVNRAKWNAWNELGSMSQDDAKKEYVKFIGQLAGSDASAAEAAAQRPSGTYTEIDVKLEDGVYLITLNRPTKKNAITQTMYRELMAALKESAADDNVVIAAVTGAGDFFTSGNDLSNFTVGSELTPEERAERARILLTEFVGAFIDYPKPLIGLVNGPAVGIAVTTLALYDVVYASDSSTFHTPFTTLGQSAEGCSSVLFPKIMGYSKAFEMLAFNRKLSAKEALDAGFISEVFPQATFRKETMERVRAYAKLPRNALMIAKRLVRGEDRAALHKVNAAECNQLKERWQSDECMNAIAQFFSRKSKL